MSTDVARAWILAALAALAAAAVSWPSRACAQDEAAPAPTILVQLADGGTVPLLDWSLSYDYLTWPKGGSPVLGNDVQKKSDRVLLGKKSVPVAGSTMEIGYREVTRTEDVDGKPTKVKVGVPSRVTITTAGGDEVRLKVEPPDRQVLAPEVGKDTNVLPRSLDLQGSTVTGTRRTYCLLSFTSLVECGTQESDRVVGIRFAP